MSPINFGTDGNLLDCVSPGLLHGCFSFVMSALLKIRQGKVDGSPFFVIPEINKQYVTATVTSLRRGNPPFQRSNAQGVLRWE